jgi:hypothetical protein
VLQTLDTVFAAHNGSVSTTKMKDVGYPKLAATIATWWLQQPQDPYRTLTAAVAFLA